MVVLKYLYPYIKKYKVRVVFFVLFSLLAWGANLGIPYIISKFLDSVIYFNSKQSIYNFTKIFILICAIEVVSKYYKAILKEYLEIKIAYDINFSITEHIKRLPITFFKNIDSVYLTERVKNDCFGIVVFMGTYLLDLIIKILTLIVVIYFIMSFNISVAIRMLWLIPLFIVIYRLFKKPILSSYSEYIEDSNKFTDLMAYQIQNIKFIKINSWFEEMKNDILKRFDSLFYRTLKFKKVNELSISIESLVNHIGILILLYYGGMEILRGKLTIGEFIMINTYFGLLLESSSYILRFAAQYQTALVSYGRLQEILNNEIEHNGDRVIDSIEVVTFENVSFGYNNNRKILDNFNFTFCKGNIYCLFGENGSGKSTFVNLLTGIINNYEGSIKYNGIDIKNLDMYKIRKKLVGVTEQEPRLLKKSIVDNIIYGLPYRDDVKIKEWCKRINIYDFIESLPSGFETIIEEESNNLSGGEKQKISIVRTLVKDSDMLIFDEPTSALDRESIDKLKNVILDIKDEKIIFIISHDREFASISDKIIHFSNELNCNKFVGSMY
ncbi:ABC transporter ATP-binding protein [Caloranaerobacter ferrireducens]|uniref:ABC transporter ATP-binding protein n=1 Tax=Caloranaerobacter ferrireducens TaxID=1323370 RepID=UPI00084E0417|nr:ABC transporter ATP-binding protein [Caloranaerobacter ferrireducens]